MKKFWVFAIIFAWSFNLWLPSMAAAPKLSLLVDKSDNTLMLRDGEEVLKTYIVSTGAHNSTPAGTFKIVNKIKDPTWFKEGQAIPSTSPGNHLGPRWMGFDRKSYGIHGTVEPQKLGQQVSAGCIRMKNEEVKELFELIPVGTEVTIQN